jgi:simple sugar transport system ATP-binding protein
MRRLTDSGVSIIFITHKLKEVMKIADRISVMRRGRLIETITPSRTNEPNLAKMMVGHEMPQEIDKASAKPGQVVLDVKGLTVIDERKAETVRDVSFQVKSGEILGLAGVQGNGQTELSMALNGLIRIKEGTVSLSGKEIVILNPRNLIESGVAHIPEDRLKYGLVQQYTIADNQVLCTYYKKPFAHKLQRNTKAVLGYSKQLIQQFDIRASGPMEAAETLSGGNQQKLIVSRELSREIRLLIANQPTRGLDVGSTAYVHRKILEMRNRGVAVLLISVELDEIMSLSDRIAVMYNGKIVSILPANQVSKEHLGLIMLGTIPSDFNRVGV